MVLGSVSLPMHLAFNVQWTCQNGCGFKTASTHMPRKFRKFKFWLF